MKQAGMGRFLIATSAVAFATLFSVGWSEQRGVSLSVESAQARVGRPLTPLSASQALRVDKTGALRMAPATTATRTTVEAWLAATTPV